ncbi:MAG: hypothetical protein KDD25_09260 [Bdellovibrionales bacterium]|nr:hypothetical protein [Bdellovibrionales bacterium]
MNKIVKLMSLTLVGLVPLLTMPAQASIEVFLSDILFPSVGFDDNDSVEIVLDGELPNTCYEIGSAQVRRVGNVFWVSQYSTLRDVQGCDEDQQLPEVLDWPVNYSNVITLGKLKTGDYKVAFIGPNGEAQYRPLNIAPATGSSIDEKLYAPVTSAFVPEIMVESDDVQVALTGVLKKSCVRMKEDDRDLVQKIGNVLVILPELELLPQRECFSTLRPIHQIVSLGHLEPGRYLLHVRSAGGRAVNRTFSVIKNPNDPRSE